MAPRMSKKAGSEREIDKQQESCSQRLKERKKIESEEQTTYEQEMQGLAKYFDEESRQKRKEDKSKHVSQEFFKAHQGQFDQFEEEREQCECAICLSTNFERGKYILGCHHAFCNECFIYWSNIEESCPICYKKANEVLMILDSSCRVSELKVKYRQQACQKCGSANNEQQIYYCDSCQVHGIHVYCCPSLLQDQETATWFCQQCEAKEKKRKKGRLDKKNEVKKGKSGRSLSQMLWIVDDEEQQIKSGANQNCSSTAVRQESREKRGKSRKNQGRRGMNRKKG